MLVWLSFAILAALVIGLVIWPLVINRGGVPTRAAYDGAVYRDQLKEIARDLERSLLSAAEAASARLEIERRLLATAEEAEPVGRATAKQTAAPRMLTP